MALPKLCFVALVITGTQLFDLSQSFRLPTMAMRKRPSSGLLSTPSVRRSPSGLLKSTALRMAKSESSNGDVPPSKKKSKKKRKRSRDFPPFAYDADNVYNGGRSGRERLLIKVGSKGERTYRCDTPTIVSVPSSITEKSKLSLIDSILYYVIGASYEPGLLDITRSARRTRLLTDRAYARSEPFAAENITIPPSLQDLKARDRQPFEGFWISTPARLVSFVSAYLAFPLLTRFLDRFVTMEPSALDEITSKFGPGISILYGTFVSLTLSILYTRQRTIQDNVAMECSMLLQMTRTLLSIFRDDKESAIDAGQCAADQIRTLVRSSRGAELMLLMYSDPYARMQELVDMKEDAMYDADDRRHQTRIASCRDVLKELNMLRANRLSDEALALPPTHFLILNTLTLLILLGYTISILPTVVHGEPSLESSLLFGVLSTIYVLFYNFCNDLNNPFEGVYQIRRSCAASHLLEAKWLIANHPLLRDEVDFEEVQEEAAGVQIRTPGLGDCWFERDEIYVDGDFALEAPPLEEDLRQL